jgi:cobalt-zinc-cadmium resistance protein CzcA
MPTMDEGNTIVQLEKLPTISLTESLGIDLRVQRQLFEHVPEVISAVARTGADEIGMDPMGLNQTDTFLVLKPRDEWRVPEKNWLVDEIRKVMDSFPGVAYAFTQPIEMRVSEMLTGVRGDVAVKVFGADLATLNQKADEIAAVLRDIPGAEDVYYTRNEGVQYLTVAIDRLAAGRLGFEVDRLAALLRSQLEGQQVGTIYEGGRRRPLLLRGAADVRTSPEKFANLMLTLPDGRLPRLPG